VSERILNWGLLSTARINRAIIPPLKTSKRNRLTAVASRTQQAAEAYARQWEIERALGSYEALLDDPTIDVVYNSLPNHLHAEWSIRALRAGKHVLCEKPLAISLDEVDAMAAAAKESGKILAEAFMYRHHPQTLKVKEIVDAGRLGSIQLIKGAFTFTLRREGDIRLKKETGGGSIWDVGCYPISYARMVAGMEPEEVFGMQTLGGGGADITFVGQMRYPNEVYAQFDCGFASPQRSFMEITGTEGVLNVPVAFKPGPNESLTLSRGETVEQIDIKGGELYIGEVEDMADAILLAKQPRVTLADSRGTIATILALIQSAETGRPVGSNQ
jgi:D-xylose 1-dehydrogenase (NADP+, D-xylono-1,5-lactone-forming)